jgi:hypothetical protein
MKGHIRERSPGHWAIVIDGRDPQSNRLDYHLQTPQQVGAAARRIRRMISHEQRDRDHR